MALRAPSALLLALALVCGARADAAPAKRPTLRAGFAVVTYLQWIGTTFDEGDTP